MNIIDYQIVYSYSTSDDDFSSLKSLEDNVKDEMIMGWQPIGGVGGNDEDGHMQAMVKYEEQPKVGSA